MAKTAKKVNQVEKHNSQPHRTTSTGRGVNSRPTNKHARRSFKKYRGQG